MQKFEANYLLSRNLRLWPNSDIINLEWPQGLIVLEIVVNGPKIWLHFISNYILNGPPQFNTPSVQHISSTQKGHSFLAPKIPEGCVEPRGFQFGTEGWELRGLWWWTEGFWCETEGEVKLRGGPWSGPCVEPRRWTERVCVELRGTQF